MTEGTPGENGHTNGGGYTGGDNCMGLGKGYCKIIVEDNLWLPGQQRKRVLPFSSDLSR